MPLRELAPGTGPDGKQNPELDIIAVHGLNPMGSADHALNTWRKPQEDGGNVWLRDNFPKAQPNARIFFYEYNSSPVFGSDKDSFVHEANELLENILQERWQMSRNIPIIFVGHSLGGLLIKQALVIAWANPEYRGLKEATHSLVFFGTPHAGPAKSLHIGLGMTCAKIARALPFKPQSNVIDALEKGTIFADILSETFRHQLETYKILSCYEGIGDIVPFDSAVLKLAGNRETQMRIDADHSNMCRFDLGSQRDQDNYKKVQRRLQMMCADALVGSLQYPHPGNRCIINGGIDLSDVLHPVQYTQDLSTSPGEISLSSLPDLAWEIYRSCQRISLPVFAQVAHDVLELHVALRSFIDKLKSDTYSTDYRRHIRTRLFDCCQTLEGLMRIVQAYNRVPLKTKQNLMQSDPEAYGLGTWRLKVTSSISDIREMMKHLASQSMNDLVDRLDGLIDSLNEGEEATRSISSRLSTANFSSSNTNDPEWNEIKQALIASGFSPEIISEQRTYILHWLENASVSGRLVQQTDLTGDSPQCLDNDTRHTMTAETQTITQDNLRLSRVNSPVSHCQSDNHPREDSLDRKGPKRERWRYSIVHRLRYLSADPFLALRKAVIRSDYSAVSRLLQEASISDRLQLEGSVFIGFAVEKKDSDMLGLFVEQCSSVDWSQILREQLRHTLQTGSGRELLDTYIKYGASFGSVELAAAMSWAPESTFCQMLRSEHNSVDYEGWAQTFLYISAKLGYTAIFEEFVKQYGGINSLVEGTTPFHIACGSGNFDVVQKAFEMGGNLMTLDSEGESPVHAVAWGEVHDNWDIRRTLRYLIGKGASLGAKTEHGKSLLHLAAEMSNVRAIETLLGVEVQCDVFDNLGNTPLHAASCNEELKGPLGHEHRLDSMPFYHPTLRRRCTQIDFRSLVNESAIYSEGYCTKIDGLKFFNRQPKPAKRGSLDAVLTLLRYGAAANRQNNDGVSPLHLASRCADIPRMLALLVNGADPNMKDNSGWTALRYAISANSGPAVQLCLEHGADTSGSAIVSVGQESEVRLTILEHIKFIRATELLYILRKHEDPECPDETIEGLEDLQNSSEYTYDNGRLKMERIRKNIEEETRRHAEQAARPKTDVLG